MKKASLLARLAQLKIEAEDKELNDIHRIQIMDLLLDYINDPHVRQAVEEVPL